MVPPVPTLLGPSVGIAPDLLGGRLAVDLRVGWILAAAIAPAALLDRYG
jgi:hypothetical protein